MTMHVTDAACGTGAVSTRRPLSRTWRSYVLIGASMLATRSTDAPVGDAAPVVLAGLGGEVNGNDAGPHRQVLVLRLVLRSAGPHLGRRLVGRRASSQRPGTSWFVSARSASAFCSSGTRRARPKTTTER